MLIKQHAFSDSKQISSEYLAFLPYLQIFLLVNLFIKIVPKGAEVSAQQSLTSHRLEQPNSSLIQAEWLQWHVSDRGFAFAHAGAR